MRNLRAAVTFLTRIPVPTSGQIDLTAAVPWFPLVGGLIGATVGGAAAGLLHLVPPFVAAALAVMLGVLLTGALHEDGLADVADAFGGGWTPTDRLRILDDPLHGSYGVAALVGSIVIRVACVTSLGASPAAAFACLVAAHALARGGAVALIVILPVARPEGLGADHARNLSPRTTWLGILGGIAIAAVATGWWAGPFVIATAAATAVIGWLGMRKLGGVSGDVLGAAEQIGECLVLATATALASRYELWWS